jgi:nucleoside-diphosphate-sugar epimerase
MRVLISGGAGFFGSVLSEYLLHLGHQVAVIDNLIHGSHGLTRIYAKEGFTFLNADIRDINEIGELDVVIHLAALVGEPLCKDNEEMVEGINYEATCNLFNLAQDQDIPFIFASTCSNYGVTEASASERTPLNPQGVYAKSKVKAENYIAGWKNSVILRFATLFGSSPRMRLDLLLNQWTYQLMKGGSLEIYQPTAYRPLVHVSDASLAVIRVIHSFHQTARGKIYNVGGNYLNYTKMALAEAIQSRVGGEINYVDKGDPRSYRVDFTKIREELGFIPLYNVDDGVIHVKRYVEAFPDCHLERCNNVNPCF